MTPSSGRLVFKFSDAFPADNPVAVLIVAMSSAFNDLLVTNVRLLGGDDTRANQYPVNEGERLYLLRASFGQLHELRETIKYASKKVSVRVFLDKLPIEARRDLALVQRLNPRNEAWVAKAITYVRNQTVHYGGRWGWEAQTWALTALTDHEGEIVMTNALVSGMRLSFADLVAVQHFTRKAPEYDDDANAEPDERVLGERLATLFEAASTATSAALRLIQSSLDAYLDALPKGTVKAVVDGTSEARGTSAQE